MSSLVSLKEYAFAQAYVLNGRNASRAMVEAFPDTPLSSADSDGNRMCNKISVQALVAQIERQRAGDIFSAAALTYNEKRSFLASVVRATPRALDEDSPLVEEVTETENGRKLKMMSKAKAIDLDNKMAGHNAPELVLQGSELDLDAILQHVTGQKVIDVGPQRAETCALWDD